MSTNLRSYLLREYGLMLLDFPTSDFVPGDLIKAHHFWRPGGFWEEIALTDKRGNIFFVLNTVPLALAPRQATGYAVNNVVDNFSLGAEVGLPQFGLTARFGIQSGVTITWNIQAVDVVKIGSSEIGQFQPLLQDLRAFAKKATSDWISECYILREIFYTSGLSGTVHTSGNIDGRGTFDRARVTASAGLTLNWENQHTFTITGPSTVPFAARAQRST